MSEDFDIELPQLDIKVVTVVADADGVVRVRYDGVPEYVVIGMLQVAQRLMLDDLNEVDGDDEEDDDDF